MRGLADRPTGTGSPTTAKPYAELEQKPPQLTAHATVSWVGERQAIKEQAETT